MDIDNVTDIIETDIFVAKEDGPNFIDTNILAYLIPYKCGFDNLEDIESEGMTPVRKRVRLYISIEDI